MLVILAIDLAPHECRVTTTARSDGGYRILGSRRIRARNPGERPRVSTVFDLVLSAEMVSSMLDSELLLIGEDGLHLPDIERVLDIMRGRR